MIAENNVIFINAIKIVWNLSQKNISEKKLYKEYPRIEPDHIQNALNAANIT